MRRSLLPLLMLGCAVLWNTPRVWAEEEPEDPMIVSGSEVSPTGDLAPNARIVTDGRPMSIHEAVALSIRNNLDVEVERFEPLQAETERDEAWGAYDPTISADGRYDVRKSPNTFTLNPSPFSVNRARGGGVGLDQLIPYLGATLNLRFDASKTTTNSGIQSLDPQFDTSFFITARVPLARDLIWNAPWTKVKISEMAYRSSRENFRTTLMDNVDTTVNEYWNLVAARDQVRVAQKSLETARALLDQTETQYEVGVVSRVEVIEAEAGVAGREFDVIRDANAFRNAQDRLIDAVLGRELSALTSFQLVPTDDPESYEVRHVDVERSVQQAFRKRPELAVLNSKIEQDRVDLKFAKNQRLPQLDAEVEYGFVGITGDGNSDLAFGTAPGKSSFQDASKDFFKDDGADNVRVQAFFSIPFPNTVARKRFARSELELRRSKTRRLRLRQTIILEVRRAARLLLASAEGIDAAERRRLAAEEQLRAEKIRLEHGESTPFEVLQRESDLVEAESQKINALQAYRAAEIGLERSQGTILDFYGVVIDQARTPVL